MPEVADGEKLGSSLRLWLEVVDKFKMSWKFTAKAAGYLIEHEGRVVDGVALEFTTNLLFGDVSSGHVKNGWPDLFGDAIS